MQDSFVRLDLHIAQANGTRPLRERMQEIEDGVIIPVKGQLDWQDGQRIRTQGRLRRDSIDRHARRMCRVLHIGEERALTEYIRKRVTVCTAAQVKPGGLRLVRAAI